ncbi:MAG: tetratricopeptide repeat protein [Actinomycetia bacterium]|nr:tetratricopeptide repeat protein [Actinomycetes bacterium]
MGIAGEIGYRAGEASTFNNLGLIYSCVGQYEEALTYYEQALGFVHEIGDRAGEGPIFNSLGLLYASLGQYEEALIYYEQALGIQREVDDRAGEGGTLHNLGAVYRNLGQYEEALTYYEQALGIVQEIGNLKGEGATLNSIGVVYHDLGQYAEALRYSEQALRIRQEIGDRAGEGATLNSFGGVCNNLGQYAKAIEYYEQSLGIRREVGDRAGEGVALSNIGSVYHALGQYAEALRYYEQALGIQREIGDRAGESATLNNIGGVYQELEQYEEALRYCEQALGVWQEIGDRASEGITLNNIGRVYCSLGQYEEALRYYEQSLGIQQEIGDRAGESATLNNIGLGYWELGQYAEAIEYYEQALGILQEIGDRVMEGTVFSNIGFAYEHQNQPEQALRYYEQALTMLESVRATAGSETGRASFIAQYTGLYHRAVNLYHSQGQDAKAFYTTERGRARAFLDALATGYVQLSDTAAALYNHEVEAYDAHQTAQQALIQARAQFPDDAALLADLEAQLAQAEADYQASLAAITARGDQLDTLVPRRSMVLDLPQVQARLDNQTTLVAYWVLAEENQVLAFIITRDAFHTVAVDVTYDDLVAAVNDFRYFANLDNQYPESLVQLYGWLITPLGDYLTTPHLEIIPHNVLHYLPFAALTDGEHFLVEGYVLTYLPSASTLPYIQENAGRAGGVPLILGNPTTGDYDATASFAAERDGLGPLPFAEQEVQAIAALYGAPAYIGPEATEGLVWQAAGESSILHLAAHGKYNPVASLSSLIALAPDAEHDGWLTVGEIYALDLHRTDLVVLSTCESQLGDLSEGDELVGMTRAFIYAGTPTVVASLWSVEDESTAYLMGRFYSYLQDGMGKGAALRQAQLDTMEEYPSPYYWAGFVLSGDAGSSVEIQRSRSLPADMRRWLLGLGVGGGCCLLPLLVILVSLFAGIWLWRKSREDK